MKSPPELWAEVSSEDTLGRHLAPFGEIRITRMEPETTVAWEGERASGTVELAPAGWGTKVVLTATPAERAVARPAPPAEAVQRTALPAAPPAEAVQRTALPAASPEGVRDPAPTPTPTRPLTPDQPRHAGFLARLRRRRQTDAAQPAPAPPESRPPALGPEPLPPDPDPAPTPAPPASAPVAERSPAPALDAPRTQAILSDVLDDLGAAHHRPFSRD